MGKTGGGRGTNQYRVRGVASAHIAVPPADLLQGVDSAPDIPDRLACGYVWGTRCRAWVYAPHWSHTKHPTEREVGAYSWEPPQPWLWQQLGQHPRIFVRQAIAGHARCPKDLLVVLARDESGAVREKVAANPNAGSVLARLVGDKSWLVRHSAAGNSAASVLTLRRLAQDEDQFVRRQVATNPSTSIDVLIELLRDEAPYVREAAQQNESVPVSVRLAASL